MCYVTFALFIYAFMKNLLIPLETRNCILKLYNQILYTGKRLALYLKIIASMITGFVKTLVTMKTVFEMNCMITAKNCKLAVFEI